MAALISNERGQKTFSVLVSVAELYVPVRMISEVLFPGVVEGFQVCVNSTVLQNPDSSKVYLNMLTVIRRDEFVGTDTKVGILIQVDDFQLFRFQQYQSDIYEHFNVKKSHIKRIVEKCDFVNFNILPTTDMALKGPSFTFSFIARLLKHYRQAIKCIHPKNFEIMLTTGWSSTGNSPFQNVGYMQQYWSMLNAFATENNFTVWIYEAFDKISTLNQNAEIPKYGLWRLTDDSLADNTSGYIEKIFENTKRTKIPIDHSHWIGGGIGVVIIILIIVVSTAIYFYRRINSMKQILTDEEIAEFRYGSGGSPNTEDEHNNILCETAMKKPYDSSLEVPKNALQIYWDQPLGTGQFGSVHKVLLKIRPPLLVALKTTKVDCPSTAIRGLLSEIKILTHLGQHPNIVSICGAYTAELQIGRIYIALELCSMGSLKNELTRIHAAANAVEGENDDFSLSLRGNLLRWSCEVAKGMDHIAQKGVIHADLATRNVLLTHEGTAKIADFGLSRRLYEYAEYVKKQQEPVPWKWMAIESLKMRQFSSKSDVWSFGVTLWEIFSLGAEPYPGYSYDSNFIENLENGSAKMGRPGLASAKLFQIMLDCWQTFQDSRPSFDCISARMSEMYAEMNYTVLHDIDA